MFRGNWGNQKLNKEEKGCIIWLVEAGWTNRRISFRTGFSRPTVAKWRNRYVETGSVQRQVGSGRP